MLNSFCVLISGLGLGWLVGLSVSPVIQIILTSLIAIIVTLSGALAGISATQPGNDPQEDNKKRRSLSSALDPLPIMCLVMGLAAGSSLGVYARTNDWLGAASKPQKPFAEEWSDTGLSKEEITKRVFYSLYPELQETKPPAAPSPKNENSNTQTETTSNSSVNTETGKEVKTRPPGKAVKPLEIKPTVKAETSAQPHLVNQGVLFTNPSPSECETLRGLDEEDKLRRAIEQLPEKNKLNRLAETCKTFECLKAGVKRLCPNL